MKTWTFWIALLFTQIFWTSTWAKEPALPPSLAPWKSWVLHDVKDFNSPQHHQSLNWQKESLWPSKAELKLQDSKLHFVIEATAYDEGLLPIVGSQEQWPQGVSLNGQDAILVSQQGKPHLQLPIGQHRIEGSISVPPKARKCWVPPSIAVVKLSIDDKNIPLPSRDASGWIWLNKTETTVPNNEVQQQVQLKVFRKLKDSQPMELETRLHLNISGKERIVELGPCLLEDSELISVQSPLETQSQASGNLKIKVKPGPYQITIVSRFNHLKNKFSWSPQSAHWPQSEIWSFEQQNHLRQVEALADIAIDPSQHDLPASWHPYPSFLLEAHEELELKELSRGQQFNKDHQLDVKRKLWLHPDGSSFTFKDEINGKMHRDWLLKSSAAHHLGRVEVNGSPRLISLSEDGSRSVEMRETSFRLKALGEIQRKDDIPSTGWEHRLDSLSLNLHLPPAWDLLYTHGPDQDRNSWLKRWNLLDVFLLLLLTFSVAKICGKSWGVLAFVTYGLTFHSPMAPHYIWLCLLPPLALAISLPLGTWKKSFTVISYGILFIIAFISLRYSIQQFREMIYPRLEVHQHGGLIFDRHQEHAQSWSVSEEVENESLTQGENDMNIATMNVTAMEDAPMVKSSRLSRRGIQQSRSYGSKMSSMQKKPQQAIQTGPGEPQWRGKSFQLSWNGPIDPSESMQLIFLSPSWWKPLRALRVFLLFTLCCGIVRALIRKGSCESKDKPNSPQSNPSLAKVTTAIIAWSCSSLWSPFPSTPIHADTPPAQLLGELKNRLTEVPQHPLLSVSSSRIDFNDDRFMVNWQVDSTQQCYFPIIEEHASWIAQTFWLNQNSELPLRRIGTQLCIAIPEGKHQIEMRGIPLEKECHFTTPVELHNLEMGLQHWKLQSPKSHHLKANATLVFKKSMDLANPEQRDQEVWSQLPIAPFVHVKHQIQMDHEWFIQTSITRIAPQHDVLHLKLPALPSQQSLDPRVEIKDGHYKVQLQSRVQHFSFRSSISPREKLRLVSPENFPHVMTWEIQNSPLWRVTSQGLPMIQNNGAIRSYRPRPGEQLKISAQRVQMADGPLKTIQNAKIEVSPGQKNTRVRLQFNIQSSLGSHEKIQFEPNMTLESVQRNGRKINTRLERGTLSLNVPPGKSSYNMELNWEKGWGESGSFPSLKPQTFSTPNIRFETELNNIDINVNQTHNLWILALGGPDMGPAVLFWGNLIAMLILAQCLPWVSKRCHFSLPIHRWGWSLLFAGFCTVHPLVNLMFLAWFFTCAWRAQHSHWNRKLFNLRQCFIVLLSFGVALIMLGAIPYSLLGKPNMMIEPSSWQLNWYLDRGNTELPKAWILAYPLQTYRLIMLLWSLWLAFSLIKWMTWGWQSFSKDGRWSVSSKDGRSPSEPKPSIPSDEELLAQTSPQEQKAKVDAPSPSTTRESHPSPEAGHDNDTDSPNPANKS